MPTPSYPSNVATVTVTGSWGADAIGTVTFTPNVLLADGTSTPPQFVLPKPQTVPLVNGAISVVLMATDDTHLAPLGWAWTVAEHIVGQASDRTYSILLPAATPVVDLTAVAKSATPPAPTFYVPLSRQITAGAGLTGGGDLSVDRTLAVAFGVVGGVAGPLDANKQIPAAQIPAPVTDNGDGTASITSAAIVDHGDGTAAA